MSDTIFTILGEPKKKPTVFYYLIVHDPVNKTTNQIDLFDPDLDINITLSKPTNFTNVDLVAKGIGNFMDWMWAYNDDRSNGFMYLGYYNDGCIDES